MIGHNELKSEASPIPMLDLSSLKKLKLMSGMVDCLHYIEVCNISMKIYMGSKHALVNQYKFWLNLNIWSCNRSRQKGIRA